MRDRFGATNPRAQQLRFHTQTAGSTLTAQQPDNNIVRVALQALAAVLGGTQSLHCNGRDEALALPTEESARIALRTQQIIAAESGVANTVDPVAGSYAIEALTNEIERGAEALLDRIDRAGRHAGGDRNRADPARDPGVGLSGAARHRRRRCRRRRREQILGPDGRRPDGTGRRRTDPSLLFGIDPEIERLQIERVRAVRASRSAGAWRAALDAVSRAARGRRQPRAARSSPRSKRRRPSAKSRTPCARSSANTRKRRRYEHAGARVRPGSCDRRTVLLSVSS